MALEGLVNVRGALADTFPKLRPDTIQHSDEISNARRDDEGLRSEWFYLADHALYRVEDDEAVLYLGRGETNPIFKNIEEAARQLINTGNYVPNQEDIEAVVKADSTLRVRISDLDIKGGDECSYFEIDTSSYESLNDARRAVAERVYGQGDDFKKNMKMFSDNGIETIRIYVLNSDYVKDNVECDGAVARACWLDSFGGGSIFGADNRSVDDDDALRGVPLSAEGGALEISPESIIEYLGENPVKDENFAAGLLKAANEFYQKRTEQ